MKIKKLLIILSLLSIILVGAGCNQNDVSKTNPNLSSPNTNVNQPLSKPALSNDNYYTNVNGNQVHSPAYSNSVPADASAKCRDGTYSFSQNRRGTCSSHGGVAQWL